jgi:hypothetical protein
MDRVTNTQNNELKAQESPAVAAPAIVHPSAMAEKLGKLAFENRDYLKSTGGSVIWRNIVKGTFAWVPTVLAFTGNRYLFKALKDEARLGKNLPNPVKEILATPFLGQFVENTSFVVAGFTTYRSFIKFWQRAYDRITSAETQAEAINAVASIPANIKIDAKDIIPHEFSSTLLAAPVLAGVRLGLNPLAKGPLDGNPALAKAGYLHDTIAATLAYSAFFEVNDRAYANISGGKDTVDKIYSPNNKPEDSLHAKKYRFFTNDGAGRMLFRRVSSVLIGFVPYIAIQRFSRVHVGDVKPFEHGLFKNLTKEYSNHVAFSVYTAESELYGKAYDKLFEKLEAKEHEKSR